MFSYFFAVFEWYHSRLIMLLLKDIQTLPLSILQKTKEAYVSDPKMTGRWAHMHTDMVEHTHIHTLTVSVFLHMKSSLCRSLLPSIDYEWDCSCRDVELEQAVKIKF